MGIADLLGWAAAGLTLLTFYATNMQRLRLLALAANGAFVAYASMAGLTPVLALHLTLIPLNLYRLMQVRERMLARAATASAAPLKAEKPGSVRPVDRSVLEHRAARMQLGGCTSSLRKAPRSRPRRRNGAETGVVSWSASPSVVTAAHAPGNRLGEVWWLPHRVASRPAERAAADDAPAAQPLSVAWPASSRAVERRRPDNRQPIATWRRGLASAGRLSKARSLP